MFFLSIDLLLFSFSDWINSILSCHLITWAKNQLAAAPAYPGLGFMVNPKLTQGNPKP